MTLEQINVLFNNKIRLIPTTRSTAEKLFAGETINGITLNKNDVLLVPPKRLCEHYINLNASGYNVVLIYYSYRNTPYTTEDFITQVLPNIVRRNLVLHNTSPACLLVHSTQGIVATLIVGDTSMDITLDTLNVDYDVVTQIE